MNYIPLNIKTHYSLLQSLIKIEDLISFAVKEKIPALGITDENMFGTIEFINACTKNNIKPIIGVELSVDNLNMILYAKNYEGYVNLLNIVSIKNTETLTKEDLKKHNSNLICVTKDYSNYLDYKEIYTYVYLSYKTKEEKTESLIVTDKVVYMNASLYFDVIDKEYLSYLYLIKDGKTIDDISNYKFDNHLNKDIDMVDSSTTYDFIKNIDLKLPPTNFKLPEYSENKIEMLINLCKKGLNKRLNGNVSEVYTNRLKSELKVIIDMDYTDYFLIVYDFILYAKKNKIVVGPGRGSAAGSLVSYTLGITEIDPIKYGLKFERFLNPERITLPDIDTDIEYLRRNEVIEYVKDKYGRDKVANIITFGTLLTKQVLRDVGRVLKIPTDKIDKLVKTIKDKETFESLVHNDYYNKVIKEDNTYNELIRISKHLEGLKRHTSIHAAGVVISADKLMNKVPLYVSGGTLLTGYSMEYLEQIGLLKMDFLAIRNLTTIDTVLKKVKSERNLYIDINKIPLNDKKTLLIFYNVKTTGIFQFESEGMMDFLRSLKIKTFDDLVLAIAIYRPGSRDFIPEFIKVREGRAKPHYIVPELESIIKDTNGIIVYQEQILEILKRIGAFSYGKADIIRRAMSKKKEDVILNYRNEFIKGALSLGYKEKDANLIYDLILKFANYGFNKSHSVAYALVAYQMAFLKAHFTEYYMMTELDMVIGNSIKTKEYIDEVRTFNLEIGLLDINTSVDKYIFKDGKIIPPLGIIKNIGKEAVNCILEERKKGKFESFLEFIRRVYNSKCNSKVIESLIYAGALDSFHLSRKAMIDSLNDAYYYANLCDTLDYHLVEEPEIINSVEYDNAFLLKKEYELFGFYLKDHPVVKYTRTSCCFTKDITKYFDKVVNIVLMIDVIKEATTKNKDKMAFVTASDEYGKITVIMFPNVYKVSFGISKGDIIKVTGRVEKRLASYQLVANKVEKV